MTTAFVQRRRDRRRARRAALRTRPYATAAFNTPTAPCEVVPVTTADGTRLRVHAYGPADGELIVLVHGWTCCLENWNPQINAFADKYRVVAYDHRGHGESELGRSRLTTDLLADDLQTVLAAVQGPAQRAVLVGHSLGGMTIQAWAARYPQHAADRTAAVVMTNTADGDLIAQTTLVPGFNRGRLRLPHWLGRLALGTPAVIPPVRPMKWVFRRQVMSLAATGDTVDFGFNVVRSCPVRARSKFGFLLADLDIKGTAASLSGPVTVVAGENDDLTPAVQADRIVETLRRAGVAHHRVTLPTGHFSQVEAYPDFNRELAETLAAAFGPQQDRISG